MRAPARSAPDGTALGACEAAILRRGRDLGQQIPADAVARQVEAAEPATRQLVTAVGAPAVLAVWSSRSMREGEHPGAGRARPGRWRLASPAGVRNAVPWEPDWSQAA